MFLRKAPRPKLHRFLQPDNYVQDPTNTQNYNRYGYCYNNPLKYIDPSGEVSNCPNCPDVRNGNHTHEISDTEQQGLGSAIASFLQSDFAARNFSARNFDEAGTAVGKAARDATNFVVRNIKSAFNKLFGGRSSSNEVRNYNTGYQPTGPTSNGINNLQAVTGSSIGSGMYQSGSNYAQGSGVVPQNNATKKFIAIVAGESTNNINEAAAIGSVMMNRLSYKGGTVSDGFVNKIGGSGQYDAIGGKTYNTIMNSSWVTILNSNNPYTSRISGAIMSLSGTDYSNGAYFWNASSPQTGFIWNMYNNGTFNITTTIGGTTFFQYSNPKKVWP